MKKYKIFSIIYKYLPLIFVMIFLFGQASIAQGANRLLVRPVDKDSTQTKARVILQAHEVRKGNIALSEDMLPPVAGKGNRRVQNIPSKGDTVSINLFDDAKYDVNVDSVEHHADGIVIVNGKIKNHRFRTVLMTIGSDGYLITLKDMNKAMLYVVSGNSSDGSGSVTQIDMKKMSPLIR